MLLIVVLLQRIHITQASEIQHTLSALLADYSNDETTITIRKIFFGGTLKKDDFKQFHQLKSLQIIACDLTYVDIQAFDCTILEHLSLSNNLLTYVPQFSHVSSTMVDLELRNNHIGIVDCNVLATLKVLVTLDLSRNLLTSIPGVCESNRKKRNFQLESYELKYLNLSDNPFLTTVDQQLALYGWEKLEKLDISGSRLGSDMSILLPQLPQSMLILTVNRANLTNNDVSGLRSLNTVMSPTTLSLAHNLLTDIPEFQPMVTQNLTELYLSHNQISTISEYFLVGIPSLMKLDLSFNQITHIRRQNCEYYYSSNLQYYNLASNGIINIASDALECTCKLVELNLSNNSFPLLPSLSCSVSTMKYLYANNSGITHLAYDYLQGMTDLTWLSLLNNYIPCMPNTTDLQESMEVLEISLDSTNNSFTCRHDTNHELSRFRGLKTLTMSGARVTTFPNVTGSADSLRMIQLISTTITVIDSSLLNDMPYLETLIIVQGHLGQFPDEITNTPIVTLYLNDNPLTEFPQISSFNDTLRYMSLSKTNIKGIDNSQLAQLTNIKELELKDLSLNYLANLTTLHHIDKLNLSSSDLSCKCQIDWLQNSDTSPVTDCEQSTLLLFMQNLPLWHTLDVSHLQPFCHEMSTNVSTKANTTNQGIQSLISEAEEAFQWALEQQKSEEYYNTPVEATGATYIGSSFVIFLIVEGCFVLIMDMSKLLTYRKYGTGKRMKFHFGQSRIYPEKPLSENEQPESPVNSLPLQTYPDQDYNYSYPVNQLQTVDSPDGIAHSSQIQAASEEQQNVDRLPIMTITAEPPKKVKKKKKRLHKKTTFLNRFKPPKI